MEKVVIQTKEASAPAGSYSQAIKCGNFIFTAQIGPLDPETGKIIAPGDIAKQTRKTIENLKKILEAGGSSLNKVIKVTAYIDVSQWDTFNKIYSEYFSSESLPARSIVAVSEDNEKLVALDMIAYC